MSYPPFLAYVGPDTMLPFLSFLAAIAGMAMMFWRYLVNLFSRLWHALFRRPGRTPAADPKGVKET